METRTSKYRKGVGLVVINKKLEVFIGKRIDTKANDAWQMPQGGIDQGESPAEAALRELKEETGLTNVYIIAETKDWFKYDIPDHISSKLWDGKYIGQQQKWFLVMFQGENNEIDLNHAKDKRCEFSEWKWCKLEELVNCVISFKRQLYIDVLEQFRENLIELRKELILNKKNNA